jgi:putative flippase GtrA
MDRLPQVVRFLLLGGLAAAINWLVRFPLSAVLPFDLAVIAAYMIGMSAGFLLYRTYVFPGSSRPVVGQSVVFLAVNLVGAGVVLGFTWLFLSLLSETGWPLVVREGLAHGAAIGIGAVANFFGHKTLTFART